MWRSLEIQAVFLQLFLLTHPVWDVTKIAEAIDDEPVNFYSHIPCGMWRNRCHSSTGGYNFYSHIPCGMWPFIGLILLTPCLISTHTSRVGCDIVGTYAINTGIISTHTSRVGCDEAYMIRIHEIYHFYSHIPCGMWLFVLSLAVFSSKFLLTHPVWDVTNLLIRWQAGLGISTHTSRVGCDHCPWNMVAARRKFLLTHPVWDVTFIGIGLLLHLLFLLTHPVWDVTIVPMFGNKRHIFLLTHPVWDVTNDPLNSDSPSCEISTHTSRVGCDGNTQVR